MSLDLFGADTLADQYVTLRVVHIDTAKLRQKIGGNSGSWASFGVSIADTIPKAALDATLPVLITKLRNDYGVELEATTTSSPPKGVNRGLSEFWPGLLVGTVGGASALVIWRKLLAPLWRLALNKGAA